MNTAWNSRPLAECTVISCSASSPASAWFVARLQRRVREKGSERRILATLVAGESDRRVAELLQIFQAILTVFFALIERLQGQIVR